MYYLIYKITNLINDKIYIGKHKTNDIEDDYMGSGKILKIAKQKYGIEHFKKEIMFECETEEDMNLKEVEIVNAEFIKLNSNYNLMPGGQGGNTLLNYTDVELMISNNKKSKGVTDVWDTLSEVERFKRNSKGQNNTNQIKKGDKISKWRKDFFNNETEEAKLIRVKKASDGAKKVPLKYCSFCKKSNNPGNHTKHEVSCNMNPNSTNYGKIKVKRVKKVFTIMSPSGEIFEERVNFRTFCNDKNISPHLLKKWFGQPVEEFGKSTSKITDASYNSIGWTLQSIQIV